MRKKFFYINILLCIFLTTALTISCQKEAPKQAGHAATAEHELYICPMHPQITADRPGDCPICGMRLVKKETEKTKPAAEPDRGPQVYICPMHPQITSEDPKYKCPICGMDLVLKKTTGARPAGSPSGLAAVNITEFHRKQMGLAYSMVEMRNIIKEVRTSARIVPDETRLYRVTTKIDGYVEKLFVNVTGQEVKKGQPLLSIYSPELVATQQEFLTALPFAEQLSHSGHESISSSGKQFVDSARKRLKLWDISDQQIKRLEKTGEVEKFITLYAPASGYVFEKTVLAGQKILPGEPLLVVADLSTVWAEADIYESDLPYIKVGMPVTLTLSYWPEKSFQGEVSFLNPFLDPQTRTVKARLNIANPELLLKVEMYGDARLHYDLGPKLAVPETAVMQTGRRSYVFVVGAGDEIKPVEVTIGTRTEGFYELLSGLTAGERVVTSSNFLLDSESSLKAALQAVTGGGQ